MRTGAPIESRQIYEMTAMAGDGEKRKGAQKGADFGPKRKEASSRKAALAAALRANLVRRKAREREVKDTAQASDASDADSEG